jgi:hypothetical protein
MTRNLAARTRRRGTILPLVVVSMVAMCGFVALAIDIGLIAVAKTQCQNSADAASVAGARSLDGSSTQNIGSATTANSATANALATAQANKVLQDTIPQANITITFGALHYDATNQVFIPNFPPVPPDNYNLCQVGVSYDVHTTFAPVFQIINPSFNSVFTVTAGAQGAHRPRDVGIVLDYSGSMNNESDLWNNESYLDNGSYNGGPVAGSGYVGPATNNPNYTSNNMETVYPLFGHYVGSSAAAQGNNGNDYSDYSQNPNLLSPAASSSSPLFWDQTKSSISIIGKCNVTVPVLGVSAMAAADFYSNNRGATAVSAFTPVADSLGYATTPGGDNYLVKQGTNTTPPTYAHNLSEILGSSSYSASWELGPTAGYKSITGKAFNGYTVGPRYWGKTFFIWPPDPTNDWRSKYFNNDPNTSLNSNPLNDNTKLFSTTFPGYKDPPGNYQINYKAILNFIANVGPNPFPSQLRGGSTILYDSIPTDVPAAAYDHTQPNYNITDPNQRFWKEYIDWTLGVWRAPIGGIQHTQNPACSIGPDFMYGTVQVSAPPTGIVTVPIGGIPTAVTPYMNYTDNPWRPRHRMWFGPQSMVQFMMDCGYLPGNTHDISMFPMKQGIGGALTDIKNNHPNDLVSMILYNRPLFANDPKGANGFSDPQFNLNKNYNTMLAQLWIPPGGSSADQRLWDSSGNAVLVPRAFGDYCANTTSNHGLMLAYNQYSSNSTLQTTGSDAAGNAGVGGYGRKGAARMIIYETDGMANETSIPTGGFTPVPTSLAPNGAYNSYYAILPGQTVNGGAYSQPTLLQVAQTICNKDDGTPYVTPYNNYPSGFTPPTNQGYPGYSTPNKPVLIYCVVFGAIFETPNSAQSSAVPLMQQVAAIGNTVFPASSTDPQFGYLWCIGSLSDRQNKLQTAFLKILDSSVPVSLIQ